MKVDIDEAQIIDHVVIAVKHQIDHEVRSTIRQTVLELVDAEFKKKLRETVSRIIDDGVPYRESIDSEWRLIPLCEYVRMYLEGKERIVGNRSRLSSSIDRAIDNKLPEIMKSVIEGMVKEGMVDIKTQIAENVTQKFMSVFTFLGYSNGSNG